MAHMLFVRYAAYVVLFDFSGAVFFILSIAFHRVICYNRNT